MNQKDIIQLITSAILIVSALIYTIVTAFFIDRPRFVELFPAFILMLGGIVSLWTRSKPRPLKRISTEETLFDNDKNRKKFMVMNKIDIMVDDADNADIEFWVSLDDFLQWGRSYRITIEELL